MENGILIINKPKDMTSRDVVNIACKKLGTKHIGHTGTLDPIATGVLVLGVNDGCKIIELLTSSRKVYEAEVIIGLETDTLDITGKIINKYDIENIDSKNLQKVLNKFVGKYMQEVPKFSAVHVNGKRLHEYARNDIDVELPKREVEIFSMEYLNNLKKEDNYFVFSFKVDVSKGTYIRSLIRDIGNLLGYPCTMKNLIRLRQGTFVINQAIELEQIDKTKLVRIEDALDEYERVVVDDNLSTKIINGAVVDLDTKSDIVLIFNKDNQFLAIYKRYDKDPSKMKPYRVFGR